MDPDGNEVSGGVAQMADADDIAHVLQPRGYHFVWKLVKDQKWRVWKRPPEDYCDRCAKHETVKQRLEELHAALTGHK